MHVNLCRYWWTTSMFLSHVCWLAVMSRLNCRDIAARLISRIHRLNLLVCYSWTTQSMNSTSHHVRQVWKFCFFMASNLGRIMKMRIWQLGNLGMSHVSGLKLGWWMNSLAPASCLSRIRVAWRVGRDMKTLTSPGMSLQRTSCGICTKQILGNRQAAPLYWRAMVLGDC